MKVTLSFSHKHVSRDRGASVVEDTPLGDFDVVVSLSPKDHARLEQEMDRDFHGGSPRLRPRVDDTIIVLTGVDTVVSGNEPSPVVKQVIGDKT